MGAVEETKEKGKNAIQTSVFYYKQPFIGSETKKALAKVGLQLCDKPADCCVQRNKIDQCSTEGSYAANSLPRDNSEVEQLETTGQAGACAGSTSKVLQQDAESTEMLIGQQQLLPSEHKVVSLDSDGDLDVIRRH